MEVAVDRAGKLLIAKQIRERPGIAPGMKLDIRVVDGKIEIEPAYLPLQLVPDGQFLVIRAPPGMPPLTSDQVRQVIEGARLDGRLAMWEHPASAFAVIRMLP
jgi:AbrB family looped-hinge helix DNA binding protein